MIYKFNKESLSYDKISHKVLIISFGVIMVINLILTGIIIHNINDVKLITSETRAIILSEDKEFSPEKLRVYIEQLNIKFPSIVMAQAELETGNFTSKIFKENHNLFGMKVATQRPTISIGEQNGHALYTNWKESVIDYALYNSKYLSDIKTEKQYLQYLKENYSQDTVYISKLTCKIIR